MKMINAMDYDYIIETNETLPDSLKNAVRRTLEICVDVLNAFGSERPAFVFLVYLIEAVGPLSNLFLFSLSESDLYYFEPSFAEEIFGWIEELDSYINRREIVDTIKDIFRLIGDGLILEGIENGNITLAEALALDDDITE